VKAVRFAFYGRLSTDDRQDVTLARPSQLRECEKEVAALDGEITAEWFDIESGSHDQRPGLLELIAEARDPATRRFDQVVVYSTSRLARDRVDAALFERDLRRLDVPVVYASGGSSPLEIAIKQAIDEHERRQIKIETRRGQAQNIKNGYRSGGRAPYGYRLAYEPHPVPSRAAKGDRKSRLALDAEQAPVIRRIFVWWVHHELGTMAIADRLNAEAVPSPVHTNPTRNVRRKWAKSTIRAMLENPVYTGRLVWDRTDHSVKRECGGGGARSRDRSDWVVSDISHPAIVDEPLYNAAQARFAARTQRSARKGTRRYLLAGFVKCASGHESRAMFGATTRGYIYMRCNYGIEYGQAEASAIPGHGAWCSVREDALLPLVLDFFQERVFGAARLDRLAKQLDAGSPKGQDEAQRARLQLEVSRANDAIATQVRGLEAGVDPTAVRDRIEELKAELVEHEATLAALPQARSDDYSGLARNLAGISDLGDALREAEPSLQRRVFEAFRLRVLYDRIRGEASLSVTVDEDLAGALGGSARLSSAICSYGHGGGRIRTCEGRAKAFTAPPL
jgi:site-specific DNA recombinase